MGLRKGEIVSSPRKMWPWFPRDLAEAVRKGYPDLWARHGTGGTPPTRFTEDHAYYLWDVLCAGDPTHIDWDEAQDWVQERRERYFARHVNDYRVGGVIAAIKWGGVLPMRTFQPGVDLTANREAAIGLMLEELGYMD